MNYLPVEKFYSNWQKNNSIWLTLHPQPSISKKHTKDTCASTMFLFKNYSSWCVSYHTQRKNHLAPNETNHRALKVQTRRHVSFVFLFTHKSMGERDTHTQIKTSFHFVTETYSCLPFNSLSGQSPGMIPLTTIVKLGLSMASQCPQVTPNDHKILSAPANVYLGHTSPSLLLKPP